MRPTRSAPAPPQPDFTVTRMHTSAPKSPYPKHHYQQPEPRYAAPLPPEDRPSRAPRREREAPSEGTPSNPSLAGNNLPTYFIPSPIVPPPRMPEPVVGPSRVRGGKTKFFGGFKLSLLPKWGGGSRKDEPVEPTPIGREVMNLDDPPPPPESPILPPLLPTTPTVYTEDTLPAESRVTSLAETTISRRRTRVSRPPPPPPSSHSRRTPKRPSRRLPPPASTAGASWVTFGRFDAPAPPSTYQSGVPSTYGGAPSTFTAAEGESVYRGAPSFAPSGRGDFTDTADGLTSLASRPATPDASTPGGASRRGPSPPQPVPIINLPGGTSTITETVMSPFAPETVPSQYQPETDVGDTYTERGSRLPPSIMLDGARLELSPEPLSERPLSKNTYLSGTEKPESQLRETIMSRETVHSNVTEAEYDEAKVEDGGESDAGTAGGNLTRNNTKVSRFSRAPLLSQAETEASTHHTDSKAHSGSGTPKSKSAGSGARKSKSTGESRGSRLSRLSRLSRGSRASRRMSRTSTTGRLRRSSIFRAKRIRDPLQRYSRKPFAYFNRYPVPSTIIDPKHPRRPGAPSLPRTLATSSTGSSQTYIPTRWGRIRRLFKNFMDLPWVGGEGTGNYYGREKGITATHYFRRTNGGGGLFPRPKRDSRIPRAPWYRPKQPSSSEMAEHGGGLTYPHFAMNSGPLTDGSERGTIDRVVIPAGASPFVSPFAMRSPYDQPQHPYGHRASPGHSPASRGAPSPLATNVYTHHQQSSPSVTSSRSTKSKVELARLRSYDSGTMSPPMPPGMPPPPSAHPEMGGYFPQGLPPGPGPKMHRVPAVPSTAWQSTYTDHTDGGVLIHTYGQEPMFVPFQASSNQQGYSVPGMSRRAQHRHNDGAMPITMYPATTPGSSPRMHMRGKSMATMNEYFPPGYLHGVEIGAAV